MTPKQRRDEINRLYAALLNFLTVGYDAEYQHSESAIQQLEKLRGLALENAKTTRSGKKP